MRRAFTLIELLIVITVMLAMTAITVSVMAPALAGRRTREATRMIDVYLNGARNRATLIGRPVGVIFERVPGLPEACATLAYAEVPPPYAGDTTSSTISIEPDPASPGSVITTFPQGDSGWTGLLRPGDVLKLDGKGHLYRIDGQADSNGYLVNTVWTYTNLTGGAPPETPNRQPFQGSYQTTPYITPPQVVPTPLPPILTPTGPGPGTPFQIIRHPERSSADSLQLPSGIVVDLSSSGFSMAQPGAALPDTWRFPPNAVAFPAGDTTSVIVMFTPTGSLSEVYCWNNRPFNATPPPLWESHVPLAPLHFLVGRRENVPFNPEAMGPDNAWGVATVDDDGNGVTDDIWESGWPGSDDKVPGFNLQDLTSLWVSVNPQSGMVVSAENAAMTTGTPMQRTLQARDIALESQAMGGR